MPCCAGEKTATAGLHGVFEDDPRRPRRPLRGRGREGESAGDRRGDRGRVIPAPEIDLQFARDEGEGFESVEDWHEAHERFFERTIEPETLIDAVRFRVVERL